MSNFRVWNRSFEESLSVLVTILSQVLTALTRQPLPWQVIGTATGTITTNIKPDREDRVRSDKLATCNYKSTLVWDIRDMSN